MSLTLEFIYNYCATCGDSMHYNCAGELVYSVGNLGVVLNVESRTQRFFAGHRSAVTSVALHRDGVTAASSEAGRDGAVLVWDSQSMELLAALHPPARHPRTRGGHGDDASGGAARVCFGPDAGRLVVVDGGGRVAVWDWRRQAPLLITDTPPPPDALAVVSLAVNQFAGAELRVATAGPGGTCFWSECAARGRGGDVGLERVPGGAVSDGGAATAVTFVDARTAAMGTAGGAILLWVEQAGRAAGGRGGMGYAVVRVVAAAHGAAVTAVRCGGGFLVSGGGDGMVHRWSLAAGRVRRDAADAERQRVVVALVASVDVREARRRVLADSDSGEGMKAAGAEWEARDGGELRAAWVTGVCVFCDSDADEVLVAVACECGDVYQVTCTRRRVSYR
jgi:WD40 repeat protein